MNTNEIYRIRVANKENTGMDALGEIGASEARIQMANGTVYVCTLRPLEEERRVREDGTFGFGFTAVMHGIEIPAAIVDKIDGEAFSQFVAKCEARAVTVSVLPDDAA